MDSEEQRHQRRIETIYYDYLDGETPVLACTLLKGELLSSPWRDKKKPYPLVSTPKAQLSTTITSNAPQSPPSPPQEAPASSQNESTQEFDSDNELTIPYDVFDMENSEPEDVDPTVSSSPPKKL